MLSSHLTAVWRWTIATVSQGIRRAAKTLAIYTLLVVPPVAGLILILHAGGSLDAPRSVGGDWVVTRSPSCAALRSSKPLELHIAQSGERATGTFNDDAHTTVAFAIRGRSVSAHAVGDCAAAFELHAPDGDAPLAGTLHWNRCGGCDDEPFTATRKPQSAEAP